MSEDEQQWRERSLTPEITQIHTSNPSETIADAVMSAASVSKIWNTTEEAVMKVNRWARQVNGLGRDVSQADGGNLLSLRGLWESTNYHGDLRPFTHKPWVKRAYGDVSDKFPRQDMLPVLETLIAKKIGYVSGGTPDTVNQRYIERLREVFGEKMVESRGIDADGKEFVRYSVPSFIEGVRIQILLGGKYKYFSRDAYPSFSDIAMEFDQESLDRVRPFSEEFVSKVADRFNWFKDSANKDKNKNKQQQRTTSQKQYSPLDDVPTEVRAAMSQAMRDLGIEEMKFADVFEFQKIVKGKYRKMAKDLHPDVNPDSGERMKEVNNANDYIKGLFKDKWKKEDNQK